MSIGLDIFDTSFGDLEKGKLYCVCCTSNAKRINLVSQVSVRLLAQRNRMAIIALDYNKQDLVKELKESYRALEITTKEKLSLWVEYQPTTTYSQIQDTLQRIIYRGKNAIDVLLIDNLIKIRTDFHCNKADMCIAANLYLLKMLAIEYKIPIVAFAELYPDKTLRAPLADSEYIDKMVVFHTPKEKAQEPIRYNSQILSTSHKITRTIQREIPFSLQVGEEIINNYRL